MPPQDFCTNKTPVCEEVGPKAAVCEEVETRPSKLGVCEEVETRKLGMSKPLDLSAFSWLQWSPPADSKCGQTLSRCFPGALPGPAVVARTKGAYAACKCGQAGELDEMDMQQSWLKQQVNRRYVEIKSADDQLLALIRVAYEAVKEKLLGIINTDFGSGKLILIGGIQLNMPKPWEDHFQPLYYKVHQKGVDPVDILDDMCSF